MIKHLEGSAPPCVAVKRNLQQICDLALNLQLLKILDTLP
jgi:hypothetical protein